jgi:hypothetical protein
MLGMNPSNARSRLRTVREPYGGPEYLVVLHADGVLAADGRTYVVDDVVACARAWLAHATLEALAREIPFIDAKGRVMRALSASIDSRLECVLEGDPSYHLRVRGENRSCRVELDGEQVACYFLLGDAQIARVVNVAAVQPAITSWLIDKVPLPELAARVPDLELERHALVLEREPARWHWLHLLDRVADPSDVLAPLRELVETLAASPIATKFYSYSSLNRLCFSASSHYPWVDAGLPAVVRATDGSYVVLDASMAGGHSVDSVVKERCTLVRAAELIEQSLAASPLKPFFGSGEHRVASRR